MLVVEDLQADDVGILGFCGAVESPQAATTASSGGLSTYISLREGREIDELTAILLARALLGWLGKEPRDDHAGWPEGDKLLRQEGEMVDWVDTRGRVICALPRPVVHTRNVLHRGAGVMIRNDQVLYLPTSLSPRKNFSGCNFHCLLLWMWRNSTGGSAPGGRRLVLVLPVPIERRPD